MTSVAEKIRNRLRQKVIYMAHPYGGDPKNLVEAKKCYRWIALREPNCAVIADWIITCEVFDERHRERGMAMNRILMSRCNELWLVGPWVSPGMEVERTMAEQLGIYVRDWVGRSYD